ncbi:sensor domain-containing protein [Paenibacillus abyssi]|uniref:GGDEF domain-containing protein n=1 Tax=Paenibacillus abyssi TaxID=1340531 RepID=A0A917FK04_9BACL|nr:GGDEF domain-containing protein [Paenibacillus abyssi]GGF87244.1 hypothetical protein GCM10010916_00740 [Paenibacillus abyssi]
MAIMIITPKKMLLFFLFIIISFMMVHYYYSERSISYYIYDFMLVLLISIIVYILLRSMNRFSNALSEKDSFLQVILESMREGVIVCDTKGNITFVNEPFIKRWNMDNLQYPIPFDQWDQTWELCNLEGIKLAKEEFPLAQALNGKEVTNLELMFKDNNKVPKYFLVNGRRLYEKSGELLGAVIVINDITELKQAELTIRYMAFHDSLTGLPNRDLFSKNLIEKIKLASQNNEEFSIMFLDLDGYKKVNDTLGHEVGDYLLKQVATRLSSCIRPQDLVARHGGDEFLIMLENISDDETNRIAELILRSIGFPYMLGGHEIEVSASIGISRFPRHGMNADSLIKSADKAMYRSKESGKNMYTYSTDEM